jgi:hypothetical protein
LKLLVYMRDGRTVFALKGRGELTRLVSREPGHEENGVIVVRGVWNPTTGAYIWTPAIRLRFIAKGSIAYVEEGTPA